MFRGSSGVRLHGSSSSSNSSTQEPNSTGTSTSISSTTSTARMPRSSATTSSGSMPLWPAWQLSRRQHGRLSHAPTTCCSSTPRARAAVSVACGRCSGSTSRSMGGGGGGGYRSYSAPSVTVMPSVVMPLAPVGGYGYGYGVSFFPAPSALFSLFALAIFAFVAVNTFTAISGSSAAAMDDAYGPEPITVAKVQVGLLGLARTLKDDLDSLAVRADTSGSRGLHMLLQETVLALLRNPDYYVYGGAAADEIRDGDKAERRFNRLSMEERSKFREETLSNVGGVTRRRQLSKKEDGVNELMVVTIVVAAEGRINLPKINNSRDLRAALNALGGISPTKVVAVELLWTPQAEGDYYTRDEVIADYPDLVPL